MTNSEELQLTPDDAEVEVTAEHTAEELRIIDLSQAEYEDLSDADPDSDEVAAFMEANGITAGSNVIVMIEGREPFVAGTSGSDFLTTDRQATAELAAKSVADLGVESELEPEADVEHESDPKDVVDTKFGHQALESLGVDAIEVDETAEGLSSEALQQTVRELAERMDQMQLSVKSEINGYKEHQGDDIHVLNRKIEGAKDELRGGQVLLRRALNGEMPALNALNGLSYQLEALAGVLARGSQTIDTLMHETVVIDRKTTDRLNGEVPAQRQVFVAEVGEGVGQEGLGAIAATEDSLRGVAVTLDQVKSAIVSAGTESTEQFNKTRTLLGVVNELQLQAKRGRVDENSLHEVYQRISQIVEADTSQLKRVKTTIEEIGV